MTNNKHNGNTAKIKEYVATHGPATSAAMAAALGIPLPNVQAAIGTMTGRTGGLVVTARQGRYTVYGIKGVHEELAPKPKKERGPVVGKPYRPVGGVLSRDLFEHQKQCIAARAIGCA